MHNFVIMLLIAVIIVSYFLWKLSEKKENEKVYNLFRKGVILRSYKVTGHAFKKEILLYDEVVLDRKGRYVLLQCGKNTPFEEDIDYIIMYSDKLELIWDGKVIATFGCNY